jgi:hypothetical protein
MNTCLVIDTVKKFAIDRKEVSGINLNRVFITGLSIQERRREGNWELRRTGNTAIIHSVIRSPRYHAPWTLRVSKG